MKRLTSEPWFSSKRARWGVRPITKQGRWVVIGFAVVIALTILELIHGLAFIHFVVTLVFWAVVFGLVVELSSDRIGRR